MCVCDCVCLPYCMGLMQPLEGLLSMRSSQVLHLTNVNPHVTSVLESSKYASPQVRMCRQKAAAALNRRRGGVACGVGSFAFQGTNGQAVMSARPEVEGGPRPVVGARSALCLLDRQRTWVRRRRGGDGWFTPPYLLLLYCIATRPRHIAALFLLSLDTASFSC